MKKIRLETIDPLSDLAIKKLLSNQTICQALLKDLLHIQSEELKYLNSEQVRHLTQSKKPFFNTVVDVLVETTDKRKVIIEAQRKFQSNYIKRIKAYVAFEEGNFFEELKIMKNETATHQLYHFNEPVYSISILDFNLFDDDKAVHSFIAMDKEDRLRYQPLTVNLSDNNEEVPAIHFVFLELKKYKVDGNEPDKVKQWLELFGNRPFTVKENTITRLADDILNINHWTKEEQNMFNQEFWDEYNHYAEIHGAKILGKKEGIEEGKIQGIKEGKIEGIKEGKIEGMKEGKIEGQTETVSLTNKAMKMIQEDYSTEEIMKQTGLSKEFIQNLQIFRQVS